MELTVDDQLAIQQLYARYNHAIDAGRAADWAACFTADGVFTSGSRGPFAGTEALTGFAQGFTTRMRGRHWTNNLVLEATPEGARGSCYLLLYALQEGQPPTIATTGVYVDALVKVDGAWKFASRTVHPD